MKLPFTRNAAIVFVLLLFPLLCRAAEPSAKPPIKLGIIVSQYTATGPHWIDTPYGYGNQLRRLAELRDPSIELYPVIEPGTETDAELSRILTRSFPGKTPVNGYDAAELRKLDAVMGHMIFNLQPQMADALVTAVKDGLGFIQQSCGSVTPGYSAADNQLAGMADGEYGWNPQDVDCEVVASHPLLGDLSGNLGALVRARPNGHMGELTGLPLIRVKNRDEVHSPRGRRVPAEFYPLYVSQLGKGRIIGIGFAHYVDTPAELQAAHKDRFFIHCVQWLANRPLQ